MAVILNEQFLDKISAIWYFEHFFKIALRWTPNSWEIKIGLDNGLVPSNKEP